MNQRYWVYGGVVALLLLCVAVRWGCSGNRSDEELSNNTEVLLAEIEQARREGRGADVDLLIQLAGHDEERVWRAAVVALGQVGTEEAAAELVRLVHEPSRVKVRAAAAEALGANPAADPAPLYEMLKSDPDAVVRTGVARGLARRANPEHKEALPALLAALRDPDPGVRAWAIRGVHRVSVRRFLFEPKKPPATQEKRIRFMERRLRDLGLY